MNDDNKVVAKGNPKYKDVLFRFIFGKEERKEYALQLYNALNNSTEADVNKLTFNTLEDVMFLGIKNDLSFAIDSQWNLYEEQSTWNPKMPYRMLKYVVTQYTRYVAERGYDEYSPTMFYLPAPKFVVFYNGTDKNIDETVDLSLSSMYLKGKTGDLQLNVKVYNISEDKNKELKEKCKPLFEYSWIVTNIRKNTSMYGTDVQGIAKSVEKTIEDMPSDFVLYKLLKAEKEGVISMIREEYTYEDMAKSHERELERLGTEKYNQGIAEGEAKGEAKGHSGEKEETIKRMLTANYPVSDISVATGLEQEKIIEFAKKWHYQYTL